MNVNEKINFFFLHPLPNEEPAPKAGEFAAKSKIIVGDCFSLKGGTTSVPLSMQQLWGSPCSANARVARTFQSLQN